MNGNDTIAGMGRGSDTLLDLLASYGSELERWPDAERAAAARRRLISDHAFRTEWESERRLDGAIAGLRAELDEEIAVDRAKERLRASVMARLPRRLEVINWRSLAAAMVLAAFLGGTVQALRPPAHAEPVPVLLDPTLPEFEKAPL
jgi:hypothetical protein